MILSRPFNSVKFSNLISRRFKYTLPDLPYDYNALEPVISAEIMQLHHQKHHQAYVTNLNVALDKADAAKQSSDLDSLVALQQQIKFNGGGNLNHSIFWKNLCPPNQAKGEPTGKLGDAIKATFGGFEQFKTLFSTQTAAVQGSGWGWLGYNPITKSLHITTTFNQDPLHPTTGLVPLLGLDVWEHAYYLQYKNARPDYIKQIWNIINWDDVSARFAEAQKAK